MRGMDCAGCVAKVEPAMSRLPGIQDVRVNLMTETLAAERHGQHHDQGFSQGAEVEMKQREDDGELRGHANFSLASHAPGIRSDRSTAARSPGAGAARSRAACAASRVGVELRLAQTVRARIQ